ncbi:HEAT repeat domain-containing protein [Litoribacter ruber]|uniref:HEAT repeat domain-containing protein n=1 Tax=Litoribacter ruber TaxID=702568 RepID=UPI001BDA148E|nr:hypothetical protein [Litoribacter ruber]
MINWILLMERLWGFYTDKTWVEPFLVFAIAFFALGTIMMFMALVFIRYRRIRRQELVKEYQATVEEILMGVMFTDSIFATIVNDEKMAKLFKSPLFRQTLMDGTLNLHRNYEGQYAENLEKFYAESHLIRDSFKKIKSLNWAKKCLGIEELAEMQVTQAFDTLVELSKSSVRPLKIAAIRGCIKLNGTQGLVHLVKHKDPIDTWTQLSIIHALKKGDIETTKGIEKLLTSSNKSVVSLGLKVIQALKLSDNFPAVIQLHSKTQSDLIKSEASRVMAKLENFN